MVSRARIAWRLRIENVFISALVREIGRGKAGKRRDNAYCGHFRIFSENAMGDERRAGQLERASNQRIKLIENVHFRGVGKIVDGVGQGARSSYGSAPRLAQ